MAENYEYMNGNDDYGYRSIKYTHSEYPDLKIVVNITDHTADADNKKHVKHAFHAYIGNTKQALAFTTNVVDKLWMGGSMIRTDYNISSTEGQRIKGILDTNYSGRTYDGNNRNLVSEFVPNREPYVNNSISWYHMDTMPDSVKTDYNLSYTKYMDWYGMKFDRTTNAILLKAVLELEDPQAQSLIANAKPNFPRLDSRSPENSYIALIHNADGSVTNQVDFFLCCSDIFIKEFCDANSLTFPYDYSDKSLRDRIWTWGIVFNRTTGAPIHVKAYERTYT